VLLTTETSKVCQKCKLVTEDIFFWQLSANCIVGMKFSRFLCKTTFTFPTKSRLSFRHYHGKSSNIMDRLLNQKEAIAVDEELFNEYAGLFNNLKVMHCYFTF
jgi:hypothetical protein